MDIIDRLVSLDSICKTVGPRPSSRFIRNIRRHGVLNPVLLREELEADGLLLYRIIDGNRRIAAARLVRHATVPARILSAVSPDESARLTLSMNSFRSSNHVTEFWAIRHLERGGASRRRIADEAGLAKSTLDNRDRLRGLDRRIFVGFAEGRISPTAALGVAVLPKEQQRVLGDLFQHQGRLLTREVRDLGRQCSRSETSEDMPASEPRETSTTTHSIASEGVSPDADSAFRAESGIKGIDAQTPATGPIRVSPSSETRSDARRHVEPPPAPMVSPIEEAAFRDEDSITWHPASPSVTSNLPSMAQPRPVDIQLTETSRSRPGTNLPAHESPGSVSRQEPRDSCVNPGEVDLRVGDIPSDLRLALRTVTQQAANRGVREEAWIAEVRDAYRRSHKRASITALEGSFHGSD